MQKYLKNFSIWISIMLIVFIAWMALDSWVQNNNQKKYSDLIREVEAGHVTELTVSDNVAVAVLGDPSKPVEKLPDGNYKVNRMEVDIPSYEIFHQDLGETILRQVKDGTITNYTANPSKPQPWWMSLLGPLFLVGIVLVGWTFIMNQQAGGRGNAFTKSRAKIAGDDGKKKVTFNDVAGADEEKAELVEVVEFLKNPKRFTDIGARIPKGVLLVGPPGTGKTLLAKAVAGEAGVPFFSISGSDFVELYVGVGASRVRDLFEQAKKNRPSIIFIDEIDAVGRQRGAGLGGGHDEREQTLNQLLVEMDGFGVNEGVIVIAATNRADILDSALLRPGRFDRQILVDVPDVKGREAILKVHTTNKPLASDVNLDVIAKTTVGFTGADLANIVNEAAILAARKNKSEINMEDFDKAIIRVMMGTEKKSRIINDKEKKLTAYHEAGHAVITKLMPSKEKVHQVSIIPRGRAGGFTMHLPEEDHSYMSKNEMLDNIVILLAGRVAESLVLDDISTGASNDLQRATEIARAMVTRYGMSDAIGPVSLDNQQEVFIGRDFGHSKIYSEQVAAEIDVEIRNIVEQQYERCVTLLTQNIDKLHNVAKALLEKETIDSAEFEKAFNGVFEQTKPDDESGNADTVTESANTDSADNSNS